MIPLAVKRAGKESNHHKLQQAVPAAIPVAIYFETPK